MKPAMLVRKIMARDPCDPQKATKAILYLRGGAKGKGKAIAQTNYWPQYPKSVSMAEDLLYRVAETEGYEVVGFSYKEWED